MPVGAGGPAHANADFKTQIVFSRQDPTAGNAHVFIANPNGTRQREVPLRLPAEFLGGAFWSPDGTKLLITNVFLPPETFRPATVNPDGSDFTLLDVPNAPGDMFCAAWSPNATRILCEFGGDQPGVYSVRASDGGDPVRLTTNPYGARDLPGDYSPDGRRIVFMRTKPGPAPDPEATEQGALFVANVDGTHPHQITPYGLANPHDNAFAHWSPSGREILFGGADGLLFRVHPDGSGLTPIRLRAGAADSFAFTPGWSPDGARIVFSAYVFTTQQEDIFTARPDGTHLVQVTNTPDIETFADWGATRRHGRS